MRYKINKLMNGIVSQSIQSDDASTLPKQRINWGELHEGYYTISELEAKNKEIAEHNPSVPLIDIEAVKLGESRKRLVREEREVIVQAITDMEKQELVFPEVEYEILDRVKTELKEDGTELSYNEFYYVIPAEYVDEYFCKANYEIVCIDTQAEAYKLANYKSLRQAKYDELGATKEALIIAMWEAVVEGNDAREKELQEIRKQVKQLIPKA